MAASIPATTAAENKRQFDYDATSGLEINVKI